MEKKKSFYGWVIVAACFLLTMLPMVFVSSAFSYYQYPICTELGASYVQFNVANICATIASMVFSFTLAGKLARGNMRRWMLCGGIVVAAMYFAMSFISAVWQLDILFFIANFALSTLTYIPINTLISNWFVEKKGFATSLVFMGQGVGGMIFTPVISSVINTYGWRLSFQVTAIVVLVSVAVVTLLIRKTPAEMGQEALGAGTAAESQGKAAGAVAVWGLTKAEATKTGAFWLLAVTVVLGGMVSAGIMTQVPTYLTENAVNYAIAMSVYSAVGIVAKLVIGTLYDKIGLERGVFINAVLGVLALALLFLVPGNGSFAFISVILLPFGVAVSTLAPPLIAGRLFGYKDYGAIYGLVNIGFMAGCMIGPILSSSIRTVTGTYGAAWLVYVAVFALLFVFTVLSLRAGTKLREQTSVN